MEDILLSILGVVFVVVVGAFALATADDILLGGALREWVMRKLEGDEDDG